MQPHRATAGRKLLESSELPPGRLGGYRGSHLSRKVRWHLRRVNAAKLTGHVCRRHSIARSPSRRRSYVMVGICTAHGQSSHLPPGLSLDNTCEVKPGPSRCGDQVETRVTLWAPHNRRGSEPPGAFVRDLRQMPDS